MALISCLQSLVVVPGSIRSQASKPSRAIRDQPPICWGHSAISLRLSTEPASIRLMPTRTETDRLRALIETGIAINAELSLDAVLERIAEAAARVTGARYAALGVIARAGTALERFITHGIDAATHAAIGDLPRGRGILGVLIRDARPLRLHDL